MDYRNGWQSHLLMVKPVGDGNREEAKAVYDELVAWRRDGLHLDTPPFDDLVAKRVIPPDSKEDDFSIYLVRGKLSGDGAGLLALLDGWPKERNLHIAMFYINEGHQGIGYGSELIDAINIIGKQQQKRLSIRLHRVTTQPPTFFIKHGFEQREALAEDDAIYIKSFS